MAKVIVEKLRIDISKVQNAGPPGRQVSHKMPHRNGHVIYRRASKTDPLSLKPPVCPFLQVWSRRSDRLALVLDNLRSDDIVPILEKEQLQNAGFDPPAALKACRESFFLVSEDMSVMPCGEGIDTCDHFVEVMLAKIAERANTCVHRKAWQNHAERCLHAGCGIANLRTVRDQCVEPLIGVQWLHRLRHTHVPDCEQEIVVQPDSVGHGCVIEIAACPKADRISRVGLLVTI
ncbi:hypothetical protein [Frigidibacter mobilis]|uniref:hypothetical protein n=1 Tax=Frigidibacter mobilis TaxID=1335048 RepID=UPI003AAFCFB5